MGCPGHARCLVCFLLWSREPCSTAVTVLLWHWALATSTWCLDFREEKTYIGSCCKMLYIVQQCHKELDTGQFLFLNLDLLPWLCFQKLDPQLILSLAVASKVLACKPPLPCCPKCLWCRRQQDLGRFHEPAIQHPEQNSFLNSLGTKGEWATSRGTLQKQWIIRSEILMSWLLFFLT